MTDAHIIAIGGFGILALMLLYAHALQSGLPEPVRWIRHPDAEPRWNYAPGGITYIGPNLDLGHARLAIEALRVRVRANRDDLLRWADDGGPA